MLVRAAGIAGVVIALACACGASVDDPAGARCRQPAVSIGKATTASDHRALPVHFTCNGARLAGTLYLPPGDGPHPVAIWVHGSGEAPRIPWSPFVDTFVGKGIGFFTYDKRGVGESEGSCCPDERGHLNLVTADVEGAVRTVLTLPGVDRSHVGIVGASSAGWTAPRASELAGHVAFLALASAGVLSYGIVNKYEQFAGGSESTDPRPSEAEIAAKLKELKPSGFDPDPYLRKLNMPALWLYGGADRNVPPRQSVAKLRSIRRSGKNWTIVVFPGAGHGLFDTPPTDPRALPMAVEWIRAVVRP
jgi:hypothetical protein